KILVRLREQVERVPDAILITCARAEIQGGLRRASGFLGAALVLECRRDHPLRAAGPREGTCGFEEGESLARGLDGGCKISHSVLDFSQAQEGLGEQGFLP